MNALRDAVSLLRLPVACMVAAAAAFGYLLVRPVFTPELSWLMPGSALLAGACSALNQVQEQDSDALLPRTRNRPLPAGRMTAATALAIGAAAFSAACLCLHRAAGPGMIVWACAIALAYNGLYTPLKRLSGLALLPGALAGATPPVLGWVAAGGNPLDPSALAVYSAYVLWQVPHFRLRVEKDKAAYAAAGLPLPAAFSGPPCERLRGLMLSPEVVDGGMALGMTLILADRMLFL